ncbi:MAG: transposase [Scytonematopsis contorta HA4267-MV1]|jgi:REP element-mobilizing transposase RayT|nr:transposase [Scytonematopsis contorta HA4267-MV1]
MTLFQGKYRIESTRLPNHDYASNGFYFVTICIDKRQHFFGDIINGQMYLSAVGQIAEKYWTEIPRHSKNTVVDTFVFMPDHMHGIIIIDNPTPEYKDVVSNVSTLMDDNHEYDISRAMSEISPAAGSLSVILRSYKAAVKRWCKINGYPDFGWQERFYEHIIRKDDYSLNHIREYIFHNPVKWEYEKNNPVGLWM